jgi:hypothetical protein
MVVLQAVVEEDFSAAEALNATMASLKQSIEQAERSRRSIRQQLDRLQGQMEEVFESGILTSSETLLSLRVGGTKLRCVCVCVCTFVSVIMRPSCPGPHLCCAWFVQRAAPPPVTACRVWCNLPSLRHCPFLCRTT